MRARRARQVLVGPTLDPDTARHHDPDDPFLTGTRQKSGLAHGDTFWLGQLSGQITPRRIRALLCTPECTGASAQCHTITNSGAAVLRVR